MGGGPRGWRDVASQPPAQVVAKVASTVTTVGRATLFGRAYVATVAVLLIVYAALPRAHAELAVALCLLAVGAIWYGVVHRRPLIQPQEVVRSGDPARLGRRWSAP